MSSGRTKRLDGWSPYFSGALAGLLATVSAVTTQQFAGKAQYWGTSLTFERVTKLLTQCTASWLPGHATSLVHDQRLADWQSMLVIGILAGAFLGALHDGSFGSKEVPTYWRHRFGPSTQVRALGGFLGGIVAMFGARLAGGCSCGIGLSGMMQLSASGFVAMAVFIASGMVVARLIYGRGQ